ncbi:MAG: rhodanese-like domain-containing protein [Thermoanaerobaculia bacterium]
MKITILMFLALALAAGCASEKTTTTPVAATVAQDPAAAAAPASQAAEVTSQPGPETAPLPAAPAQIAVPSRVAEVPVAPPTRADGRIGAAELAALIASGEAILVDVRSAAEWRSGHAQGAIHIPYSELFARSVELPHEALIALYCT